MITLSNVSVRIDKNQILRSISAQVSQGELIVLIGANGAGKSTLIKSVLGLLPLSGGAIRWSDGRTLDGLKPLERADRMAYVPQQLSADLAFTVEEMVQFGRYRFWQSWRDLPESSVKEQDELWQTLGLESLRRRRMSTLSGGERQKVILLSALVQQAQLLVLDEPFTGLDPRYQQQIGQILLRLHRLRQQTIFMVSHDLNWALAHATQIWALRSGELIFCGGPDQFTPQLGREIFHCTFDWWQLPGRQAPILFPAMAMEDQL